MSGNREVRCGRCGALYEFPVPPRAPWVACFLHVEIAALRAFARLVGTPRVKWRTRYLIAPSPPPRKGQTAEAARAERELEETRALWAQIEDDHLRRLTIARKRAGVTVTTNTGRRNRSARRKEP